MDKPHHNSNSILQRSLVFSNSFFFFFFTSISSSHERTINRSLSNFGKSVKSRFTSLDEILEEISLILVKERTRFERSNESNGWKRDFRANRSRDETRLVPFVWHAIDKLVIFSADVNFSSFSLSPFLLVLCPFFVHRHVDLVQTRDVYLVDVPMWSRKERKKRGKKKRKGWARLRAIDITARIFEDELIKSTISRRERRIVVFISIDRLNFFE